MQEVLIKLPSEIGSGGLVKTDLPSDKKAEIEIRSKELETLILDIYSHIREDGVTAFNLCRSLTDVFS